MVCIAAFIVLCLVGVFVAVLSIFRRDIGRKYWAVFKKSWACVGKKVRFQKCETNFKDDVKNSLLSKVVLSHPTWVKPLGAAIEVSAILIVLVTIWSLIEAMKALLALWVFGTCNVSQPAACSLSAEVCGIDAETPQNPLEWTGRWFSEWGEIFANIPDRFRSWQAEDFLVEPYTFVENYHDGAPLALDIFDPGCTVCMQSYRNQKASGFFSTYNTIPMIYVITLEDGTPKFDNSDLFARYFHAANLFSDNQTYAAKLLDRLFTGADEQGITFQTVLKTLPPDAAAELLQSWLKDFGASSADVRRIAQLADSAAATDIMSQISHLVEDEIHVKGIPTLIYNGGKHSGLFKD